MTIADTKSPWQHTTTLDQEIQSKNRVLEKPVLFDKWVEIDFEKPIRYIQGN